MDIKIFLQKIIDLLDRRNYAEVKRAGGDLLKRIPNQSDLQNLVGMAYLETGYPEVALEHFKKAWQLFSQVKSNETMPHIGAIYLGHAGKALLEIGQVDAALKCFEDSICLTPMPLVVEWHRAASDKPLSNSNLALTAKGISPQLKAKLDNAVTLHRKNLFDAAEKEYREILAVVDLPDAVHLLGMTMLAKGRASAAEYYILRAIERNPNVANFHCNLGSALNDQGKKDAALKAYDKAIELESGHHDANLFKARILHEIGKTKESLEWIESFNSKSEQASPSTILCQAQILFDMHRRDEGRALFKANPFKSKPTAEYLWHQIIMEVNGNYETTEEANGAVEEYKYKLGKFASSLKKKTNKEKAELTNVVGAAQPFYLAYLNLEDRELQRNYGQIMTEISAAWLKEKSFKVEKKSSCDVLFISGHIRDHSVWNAFMKGYAKTLREMGIKTAAFYTDKRVDEYTIEARGMFDIFVQGPKTHDQYVAEVCRLAPKIIVYPELGMDPVTVKLASIRLAKTQIASWGHPSTTGLSTVDYYLSGELLEPANGQDHYTEKLVPLKLHGAYYEPLTPNTITTDFKRFGIKKDSFKVLLPHSPFKLLPAHDEVWLEMAKKAPEAQFVFFNSPAKSAYSRSVEQRLKDLAKINLIDIEKQFVFIPWLARSGFYALMRYSDLYIDSIGFSGFNTVMQSIEAGLPVLAFESDKMRGRLGSSIVRYLGLDHMVATSKDEFIQKFSDCYESKINLQVVKKEIEEKRDMLYRRNESSISFGDFIKKILSEKS